VIWAEAAWPSRGTCERLILPECQREGIAKARAAGRCKGLPVSIDAARVMPPSADLGPAATCKRLGIAGHRVDVTGKLGALI